MGDLISTFVSETGEESKLGNLEMKSYPDIAISAFHWLTHRLSKIDRSARFVVVLAISLFLAALPSTSHAAAPDCSGVTIPLGHNLTLDFTLNNCFDYDVDPNFGGYDDTQDYINIQTLNGSGSTQFVNADQGDDPNVLTVSVDGVPVLTTGDLITNCSAGCVVSGTYNGVPYIFKFTSAGGVGTAVVGPEIEVSSSIGGAVADGATDAQGSQTVGTPVTVTYTVTNSGVSDLTIATATSSAPTNVTVNSIGVPGTTTVVASGGTTTFQVQYTPTAAGAFSFGLSFVNDDSDENPFNYTVSGTATGSPEIAVSASIGGAVTDGGTNAQGTHAAGTPVTVTYTVTNSGNINLTLATATSSASSNVTVDSITAPVSFTVAPSGTTTFAVQYTPTVAGAFSFGLNFVNDDGDENPFNFTVSGTATGTPEIAVSASIGGAVTDGGTNSQGTQGAGVPVTVTYTVTNSGTGPLTLATASASSASNVSVDSIGAPVSTTVAPAGGTTTFQVQYTPTGVGAFSFDLSFVNDDGDEDPFNYTVSGTAIGVPEIAVTASIGGAVTDGGTNAQGTQVAGTPVTVTYTVTNPGTGDLTIATATSSALSNVTVDSIGAPGSTTVIAGGGTTTFDVQYTPTLAGAFSFGLSFVNDDGDENPFNYTVSGTATGTPEIAVSASIGGAVTDGGTNAQGSQLVGAPVSVTYTVTNTGTADLTIALATSSAASNVTVGSVGAPASTTVAPAGGTTTFQVQYTPTAQGAFSFDLSFVNDDGDESPFNYTVSGTASGTPEIVVVDSVLNPVSDGGTANQGAQVAGTPVSIVFTVSNTGTGDLTLATATSSALNNVTVNSITAPGSTTVAPGGGLTTFNVQYTPTVAGAFSFELSIVNDDSDENPFNITVAGTASGTPEMDVSSSISGPVTDGGTDPLGAQTAGVPSSVTYTITNTGTANLTVASIALSLPSNVAFSFGPISGVPIIAPGGSGTVTINFTPTVAGPFSFNLSFSNDDGDENPFNYTVSGTAVGTPEIAVSASIGGAVADGGTNAQGAQAAGTPVTVTYTVTNTGTDALTLATATSSALSNVTVNSIGAPGSTTVIASGGTTTFDVQYTPTLAGAFSFDLSFVNDDPDENPFNYTVSGTASGAPEIDVSASIGGAVTDGGTNAQGTQLLGTPVTVTYTVTNTGTSDLTIAAASAFSPTNVTVNSVGAPGSTTVAPAGGTTTFDVQYTPTAAGAFSFGISFVNDDGDEDPFDFTVSGTAFGQPEIAVTASIGGAVTDGGTNDQGAQPFGAPVIVTYTVTNAGSADLTIATATSAAPSNVTVNSITAPGSTTLAAGGGTTSFQVQYTPTAAGAFSFGLSIANDDPDESPFDFTVSGTTSGAALSVVQEQIAGFMQSRANHLIRAQPDLIRLLAGTGGGRFNASVTQGKGNVDFATPSDQPVWASFQGSWSTEGAVDNSYFFGAMGAHMTLNPDLLLGVMFEVDRLEQSEGLAATEGTGYLVGPYIVGKLAEQPLYFEGRVLAGKTTNSLTTDGTDNFDFDTTRMLASVKVAGYLDYGTTVVTPSLAATYLSDTQQAFSDGMGGTAPEMRIETTDIALGLDISHTVMMSDGDLVLTGGLSSIWSSTDGTGIASTVIPVFDGQRGRMHVGASRTFRNGMNLSAEAFYDGIGSDDYEGYGLSLGLEWQF